MTNLVPEDWRWLTIKEIAAPEPYSLVGNTFGARLKASEYTESGVPILRGVNLSGPGKFNPEGATFISEEKADELLSQNALPDDVIFTQQGSVGQVGLIPANSGYDRWVVSQSQMKLRTDQSIVLPLYVYFYFTQPHVIDTLKSRAIVTGVPHINLGILKEFHILIPSIRDQLAILDVLGPIEDKIELNRRMNATLEETARALFKSWFVDFDPVRAKMEGREPVGMDAETAALFPDRLVESEMGPIPEGWEWTEASELVLTNAWTLGKNDGLERIEYVEISEVMKGEVGQIKVFDRGTEPSRARRRLKHGDTVISTVRPDRGAYFLSFEPSPSLIASTGFAVFTPKSDQWSFIYSALTQPENFERYGSLADGAAYPAISPEMIAQVIIARPSSNRVTELYHNVASGLYERAELNRRSTRTLGETRDALLPKLLSGEIQIEGVDDAVTP